MLGIYPESNLHEDKQKVLLRKLSKQHTTDYTLNRYLTNQRPI